MPITIPDATLGATFTNDITGVTYTYDGMKWVAEGGGGGDYVSKSGDTMTGNLIIAESGGIIGKTEDGSNGFHIYPTGLIEAKNSIRCDRLYSTSRTLESKWKGDSTFYVEGSGRATSKYTITADDPENALVNKKYVDQEVASASSLFRANYVSNTGQLKDGDIWFMNDRAWVSWKTLSGRIWPVNPTVEDWKFWPEGAESGGSVHARPIPESYMVWESVEDGHPMGMVTISKIGWKGFVDENGEIVGRPGYDTLAIQLTYKDPVNFTIYPAYPPAGTTLRVRLAPFL